MMKREGQCLLPGLPDDIALDCLARVPQRFHSGLRPVCRRWRDLVTSKFFRRRRAAIGTAEDIVFMVQALAGDAAAGGDPKEDRIKTSYALTLYNSTMNSWHRISMGGAAAAVPMFAKCVVAGDRLALVGGWDPATLDPMPDIQLLDLATGAWRKGAPMAAARSFFACAAGGGRVYVAGGHDGQKNALRSGEVYDVEGDEWAAMPEMGEERDECQGVVGPDGRFWAVGGYATERQGQFGASAEVYDPAAAAWGREEEFLDSPSSPAAALFAAGGRMWCVDREVREWDGKGWRAVGAAPEGMKSSPCAAAAMGGGGAGKVFVMGSDGEGGNAGWVMEVEGRKWRKINTPPGFSGFVYSAAALRL